MKKTFEKILFEIYKNFRIIFRNWGSLALIVLAPLLLILLVGYSFSEDTIHGINIGVAAENIDLSEFKANVSSYGKITEYSNVNDCILDMILERTHICLEITGSLNAEKGEIPFGNVKFYYDNTRKRISLLLIYQLKDFFGLAAEKISLISTTEIFDNLQNLLGFLNERISDIDSVKNESEKIQIDLIDRKEKLIKTRDDFTPKYLLVKSVQTEINYYADSFDNSSKELLESIYYVKEASADIRDILADEIINLTIINKRNLSISAAVLDFGLLQFDKRADALANTTNATLSEVRQIKTSLDSVVFELDNINELLNEEINRTDEYILLINQSVVKIDSLAAEAKGKMQELSKLDPSLAAKIIKPITQSFEALMQNLRDIQLAFPVLLSSVIIFISMLFSNIITLLEINNKAYTRNILAPVNDSVYTIGMAVTSFLIIFLQVAVLLVVAQLQFSVDVFSHLSGIIPLSAILVLTFVCLGMSFAYLSKNMQTSILLSTFVALAFFLLSDALNSLEAMPKIASQVAAFNPIVISNVMMRNIVFFDFSLSQMSGNLIVLLAYLFIAGTALFLISKKKNRERL